MEVPFLSLKRQYETISSEIDQAIKQVISDSAFIGGKFVRRFEENFCEYLGMPYGFGVSSGTSALHTALLALDVGPGDEVLVPSYTFIATAEAVMMVNARPVFVDSDPASFSVDIADLERRITPQTKAIIVVHLHGLPSEMDAIMALAAKHNLKVVEDCAQSHGAQYKGKTTGSIGDIACYSFYPGKNLGAYGDGGFLATADAALAERIALIRNHGRKEKYVHLEWGYCYRLDGLQAAILDVKLKQLPHWIDGRRAVAARYSAEINNDRFQLQAAPAHCQHVYHLYVLLVDHREHFQNWLKTHGVQSGVHYPIPLHLQPAFAELGYQRGDLPVAERICDSVISLPIFPEMNDDEVSHVIETCNAYSN